MREKNQKSASSISTREALVEKYKTWSETINTHGLPNITRTTNAFIRIMWIIASLTSLGYCAYSLVQTFTEYLSYKVVTQMTYQRKPYLEFPTITICNKFQFKTNDENFTYKNEFEDIRMMASSNSTPFTMQLLATQLSILRTRNLSEKERETKIYSIKNMLLSCSFNLIQCNASNFAYFYAGADCYQFNSNKSDLKTSQNPGRQNGLKMDLLVDTPTNSLAFSKSNGLVIFVHNSSTMPLTQIEGVNVAPGYETDIIISQTVYNRLSTPYSDCITDTESPDSFDSELYKMTVNQTKKYRQKYCLQLCYQRFMYENCKCIENIGPSYGSSKFCSDISSLNCSLYAFLKFYEKNGLSSECFEDCKAVFT
jgi:hypothetical protein